MKKNNENTDNNESTPYSFALFVMGLSFISASLIINGKTSGLFFTTLLMIVIIIGLSFNFTKLKDYASVFSGLIGVVSLAIVIVSNLNEQRSEMYANELKKREQAEYIINNCELKTVGVNKGFLAASQNGYLCNDGIIYYISQNYLTK
ncbi:hypothetical protein P7V44_21795 [Providencia sp. CRE-3FA-0001]|uniref:Uncharacterized protein n=1 Tax=Providencia huashanensis TaxID=3037798 RepID=A0AA42FLT6_9GAMM|nr:MULTISPECIES: hypothetical protein [unclassified Providencia]MDG4698861.1 hypothetical protein [Providencia sp. CRE-3FA-0001]